MKTNLEICEDKMLSKSKTQTAIQCIKLQRVLQLFFPNTD